MGKKVQSKNCVSQKEAKTKILNKKDKARLEMLELGQAPTVAELKFEDIEITSFLR